MPTETPTHRRVDIAPERILEMPADFRPDAIDEAVDNRLASLSLRDGPILLDLKKIRYVDIAALHALTALFRRLQALRANTYVGAPASRAARDFLRAWRYPEAFGRATGISFHEVLIGEDHQYRGEGQQTFAVNRGLIGRLEYDPDWQDGREGRRNFFEFVTLGARGSGRAPREPDMIRVARDEGSKWSSSVIRQVLRTHLPGSDPEDHIARVVIYESVSNAVRHPAASIIQAASRFFIPGDSTESIGPRAGTAGHLRISIWDDGKSVLETLEPVVRSGAPVRKLRLPLYMYDKIYVEVRDHGGEWGSPVVLNEALDPGRDAAEETILLSSFFPGISRAVSEQVPNVAPYGEEGLRSGRADIGDYEGMGLYALLRTVLDQFRGSIALRCHRYFLELRPSYDKIAANYGARYRCRVTRFKGEPFSFLGNLLTINLPLHNP